MIAPRSDLAPGHVVVPAKNLDASLGFYRAIGLPEGQLEHDLALLELRGGTHILLIQDNGRYANQYESSRYGQRDPETFDLMIRGKTREALEEYRDGIVAAGIEAGQIPDELWYGHYFFTLTDPDGHRITIYTSHEF